MADHTRQFYLLLADAILALHAVIVLFNVGALPAFWAGYFRGWRWVRNFWVRVAHLVLVGYVAAESVLGVVCPLTSWEDGLRQSAGALPRYQDTFVSHWLHRLTFYDFAPWVFAAGYGLFFAVVVFTWVRVKPRPPGWRRRLAETPSPTC